MIQNGITNFVGMLDNIMVGRVGTDAMSGVAIVNQLLFVWYLAIFGGLSGIGIFTAQFYGKKDDEGIRYTFRLMIILAAVLSVAGILLFRMGGTELIRFYLHEDGGIGSVAATMEQAGKYLGVMLIGLAPFAVSQVYATTVRSMGETVVPMAASVTAVMVNLAGNYILIYGKFGAPKLGVIGAAIATVASRFVEMAIIVIHTHLHLQKYRFAEGAFRSLYVPRGLVANCAKKGTPLLINETLWAGAQALLVQSYAYRGLSVMAAFNISNTIANVFNVSFIAMGSAIGIIIGQELGTGHMKTVRRDAGRLILFSVLLCLIFGAGLFAVSGAFPHIYNTSADIRRLAAGLIRISAACMPIYAFANASYFVLRSGGRTFVTFLFDSAFAMLITVPVAFVLSRFTGVPVLQVYLVIQLLELLKCVIGGILIHRGVWINDITEYGR